MFPVFPFAPDVETEPGLGPDEEEKGEPKCVACGKRNEYQPGPHTCWECRYAWRRRPRE